jgi:tRNA(fMet)-specific endonuclease VapC
MLYMLDTNICGYIIRNKPEHLADRLQTTAQNHALALSSVVVAELLYGTRKKETPALERLVKLFIDNFVIYDFDKKAAEAYALIRHELQRSGRIIGANDLFIAAHALSRDAVLVTNNIKEFERIERLKLENWVG